MVFVNDKKYACESCIKGHRSSSCSHTDRPLFEIKKKGRPVSQCDKCRELRKSKRVHSKCDCGTSKAEKNNVKQLAGKSKRYIPILPSLPNGLKDIDLQNQGRSVSVVCNVKGNGPAHYCACKNAENCNCASGSGSVDGPSGLDTLASAAALCCGIIPPPESSDSHDIPLSLVPTKQSSSSCCKASTTTTVPHKRRRGHSSSPPPDDERNRRGPILPPLLLSSIPCEAPPEFPAIPPLSTIASLAGTGCTCGFDCTCPGCVEHRGAEQASKKHDDCPECGTCVDNEQGVELPIPTAYGSAFAPTAATSPMSFIDAFFARAAAIPPPPKARAAATSFDPMNVTVYPRSLFSGDGSRLDEHGPAFGLVRLPKLECCAGNCGCPGETCACGYDCNGCCATHEGESSGEYAQISQAERGIMMAPERVPARDCCKAT